jgi:hypothetical protein
MLNIFINCNLNYILGNKPLKTYNKIKIIEKHGGV